MTAYAPLSQVVPPSGTVMFNTLEDTVGTSVIEILMSQFVLAATGTYRVTFYLPTDFTTSSPQGAHRFC